MKRVKLRCGSTVSVSSDPPAQDTAALVAEGYALFLLGPLWLVDRDLPMQLAGTERVDDHLCDVVNVWLSPGLGKAATDRLSLYIDRADNITRRMRFTLGGFSGTRGAVAEVDTFEHSRRFGVLWPMRSYERLVHPLPLPVHDWRITGTRRQSRVLNEGRDGTGVHGSSGKGWRIAT